MKWLAHILLVVLAICMVAVARLNHLPTEDAFRIAFDESADADERIWAMHVAANRATKKDPRLGDELARAFLSSGDERLREAAMLIDLCRHTIRPEGVPADAPPHLQDAYAYASAPGSAPGGPPGGEWTPHRLRSYVLHRRKVGGVRVGGNQRMDLIEARWFVAALTGAPLPPSDVIDAHFEERIHQRARFQLEAPSR